MHQQSSQLWSQSLAQIMQFRRHFADWVWRHFATFVAYLICHVCNCLSTFNSLDLLFHLHAVLWPSVMLQFSVLQAYAHNVIAYIWMWLQYRVWVLNWRWVDSCVSYLLEPVFANSTLIVFFCNKHGLFK